LPLDCRAAGERQTPENSASSKVIFTLMGADWRGYEDAVPTIDEFLIRLSALTGA
jgi:hypothetical protein